MPRKNSWPALLIAAILCAYILYPLGAMLAESFTLPVVDFRARQMGWEPGHQPFAAPLRRVFSEANTRGAIWGTLKISVLSVLAGGAWGFGLALLWGRCEFPGRRFFAMLGYVPILLPPLVGTLAFFSLLSEVGVLWRVIPGGSVWLSPFGQVLVVHAYSFGVYTYAFAGAALSDVDSSREEAARSLGASTFKTFANAVWPALRPAVLAAAILTFMASAASFSAPYLLDNMSHYLTVEINNSGDDPGMQRALSVVLACLSLAALPAFLYFSGCGKALDNVAFGSKGVQRSRLRPVSSKGAVVRLALSIAAAVVLLAPPVMIVATVFLPSVRGGTAQGFFDAFTALRSEDWSALLRSGMYGLASALIDLAIAVCVALALRRARPIAALPVELAVMLALALPGSVVAIALLSAFNGPSVLSAGVPLGHTAGILVLAYVIRNLPLAVRPVRAALQGMTMQLEDAASSLGARRGEVLRRVTLPLMYPSLLAAGLVCFLSAAGEYVASMLLFDVPTSPVSVRIDEHFRTDKARAYALALCLMVLCAIVIAFARLIGERRRPS